MEENLKKLKSNQRIELLITSIISLQESIEKLLKVDKALRSSERIPIDSPKLQLSTKLTQIWHDRAMNTIFLPLNPMFSLKFHTALACHVALWAYATYVARFWPLPIWHRLA